MQQQIWYVNGNPLRDEQVEEFNRLPFTGFVMYARSMEAQSLNELNQDAFVVQLGDTKLVSAIADGVGQSYRGDIAAMAVVQSLLDTLWHTQYATQISTYNATVTTQLRALAERVTHVIHDIDISYHASMFRDALEKRRRLGSESMFIALRADLEHDQLYVCWLGDCRLRMLMHTESEYAWPSDAFDTMQRWSSVRLLVGEMHAAIVPLSQVKCMLMYSDGLHMLDSRPIEDIADLAVIRAAVQHSQTLPASDDITCVCIQVHHQ